MTLTSTLVVILGGAIGTFMRYFVSVLALPISRDLPWGTIIINITGSFIIGLFGTLTLASGPLSRVRGQGPSVPNRPMMNEPVMLMMMVPPGSCPG